MLPLIALLPNLISLVSKVLGTISHPAAAIAVDALSGVTDAITSKAIPPADVDAANAHIEAMAQIASQQQSDEQEQNANTARTEILSNDWYVRRMRSTWGYALAFTWIVQMTALAILMIVNPLLAVSMVASVSQLTPLWGIGLAVLGIYTYGRTQEKRAAMTGDASAIKTIPQTLGGIVGDVIGATLGKSDSQ